MRCRLISLPATDRRDQPASLLNILRRPHAIGFEPPQRRLGILQSIRSAASVEEGKRHIEAGLGGAVEIACLLIEPNRLAKVLHRAVNVSYMAIDQTKLVVGHCQLFDRIRRKKIKRFMVEL